MKLDDVAASTLTLALAGSLEQKCRVLRVVYDTVCSKLLKTVVNRTCKTIEI